MQAIGEAIRTRVAQAVSARRDEVRLIFHGPPMELLEPVFRLLLAGDHLPIPVLLVGDELEGGNPAMGHSGKCNQAYLLALRNSDAPSYLALVPPGQYNNMSVTSTSDESGVAARCNAGNVPIEEWIADRFIQDLIHGHIEAREDPSRREQARDVVALGLSAADEVDPDRIQRRGAWRVLSRLFDSDEIPGLVHGNQVALACGLPATDDGLVSPRAQDSILEKIASSMSDGFRSGIARIGAGVPDDARGHLESFLEHMEANCDRPTAFLEAPAAFYGPSRQLDNPGVPAWWTFLTVEKWSEILAEDTVSRDGIRVSCTNSLLPPTKGMPAIVWDVVELATTLRDEADPDRKQLVTVGIERNGKPIGDAEIGARFEDIPVSSHYSPLRYAAAADGFAKGSVKVISLATYLPGLFVACRLARKVTPPRKVSKRPGVNWETSIAALGTGRVDLIVFLSPNIELEATALGRPESAVDNQPGSVLAVRPVREGQYQIEVEADENYELDIAFIRKTGGKQTREVCRISVDFEEVAEQDCRSKFEQLIRLNRRVVDPALPKPVVQLNRNVRSSALQAWMLSPENVDYSYLPSVIGEDYAQAWSEQAWTQEGGPIFSGGTFLQDPRPLPTEFVAPTGFLDARRALARAVRLADDHAGLVEGADLGEWMERDEEFRANLELYLDSYRTWLEVEPTVACWVDTIAITGLEPDQLTLSRVPHALLLSPLHPVRLAWQANAQVVLREAYESGRLCPAGSIFDPDCVPDILALALRSPGGIELGEYLSVENSTDYWSVLWRGDRLSELPARSQLSPFGEAFGISVGGVSSGFSAAQVSRALDDVSGLLSAKPSIGVLVTSSGGASESCTDGLVSWCSEHFGDEARKGQLSAGRRQVDVFDLRHPASRPGETTIANLAGDTRNSVRWFYKPPSSHADLGIVAQLDMTEPSVARVDNRSALGQGGLLRHRIRRQLPGAFLSETRQALPPIATGDALADKVALTIATMENLGSGRAGLRFAPNVNLISSMLGAGNTDYAAVSSAAIDPACFLGDWLKGAYLWDYDLPSYSQRAGDSNGYYLLSRVKKADQDALSQALARLPGCSNLPEEKVRAILLEVARRGIPTIRGLAGDDTGATGDLGLFVAARLLQDSFRDIGIGDSILPVIGGTDDDTVVSIVVPVDPFQGYLSDLLRALRRENKDLTLVRPDLFAIGIRITNGRATVQVTSIEVKCRPDSTFPQSEYRDALSQASALSAAIAGIGPGAVQPRAWTLAFQHLMLSIVGFGMRVYSQHPSVVGHEARWASIHETVAAAMLGPEPAVQIDARGRLIVIDASPHSQQSDQDGDGFDETITINREDAATIATGDPRSFYDSVRSRLGDWSLVPLPAAETLSAGTGEDLLPTTPQPHPTPTEIGLGRSEPGGVRLAVGKTVDGFEPRHVGLNISDTKLNQLNMGVVGDLGTGKTQLLKSLIYQISSAAQANRGIRPRFLIFDYKRDYSSPEFVAATGAKVVRPYRLPLNLFDTRQMGDVASPWLGRFQFFADVLDKIYSGIGPVQRGNLKKAVKASYEGRTADNPPTLYDVHAVYADLLDGKTDSPMSIIDDLVDMEVFSPNADATVPFDDFLDGVVVISLDALGQDDRSKNMLVAVMLNMFYENMLKIPKRPFVGETPSLRAIDSYLLVDEADNIMRYEFEVLRTLLLQGREFGVGIILASQYLRHFKVNATDYREPLLTWFLHKVPNITPGELSALGLTGSPADLAERVKSLQNHQCLYKSFDSPGEVVRGLPFFELMQERSGREG